MSRSHVGPAKCFSRSFVQAMEWAKVVVCLSAFAEAIDMLANTMTSRAARHDGARQIVARCDFIRYFLVAEVVLKQVTQVSLFHATLLRTVPDETFPSPKSSAMGASEAPFAH